MVTIVDYGVGNLFSLKSSLAFLGEQAQVTGDPEVIASAERILLPGVGAFGDAADKLRSLGLDTLLRQRAQAGVPIMGICLGMQMLLQGSEEYGYHEGLGMIPGTVKPIRDVIPEDLKIPHIGWNALQFPGEKHPIFRHIKEGDHVYFVHSFYGADCGDAVIAATEYGAPLTAAVGKGNVVGCQFHPEKSGSVGLAILRGFCEWEGSV